MTTRRDILLAFGASAFTASFGSFAQQQGKVWRVGFISTRAVMGVNEETFARRLHELGYVQGQNLVIEWRFGKGQADLYPEFARDLVRAKVDCIVVNGIVAALAAKGATTTIPIVIGTAVTHQHSGASAAKRATTTIPIVIAFVGDAVSSDLVASLARPSGNVTGPSFFSPELNAKRLELLKEVLPRIRRAAILWDSDTTGSSLPAMEAAAESLKLELRQFGVRSSGEFESVFAAMSKQRTEAVAIVENAMTIPNAGVAASLAARHRIPSVGFVEIAEAGGLMAYGVNFPAMYRRAAVFVDKILKGANPGDLPIERATAFDLVINRKAAQMLGVTIPQAILVRADRVIE